MLTTVAGETSESNLIRPRPYYSPEDTGDIKAHRENLGLFSTYLFFSAKLEEDTFDLFPPVVLHVVEALVGRLREGRVEDSGEGVQDLLERWPSMWVGLPTT